ncbi:MAG: hypothetical protein QXK88_02025 [Desulfurococcaceae archaeon]
MYQTKSAVLRAARRMTSFHISKKHQLWGTILAVSIISWATSAYLHSPATPAYGNLIGFKYSDIVYGVFYPRLIGDRASSYWFNQASYRDYTRGLNKCPMPYVDYLFEYPPVVGLMWATSTCIALSNSENPSEAVNTHYYLQSLMILGFTIVLGATLYKLHVRGAVSLLKCALVFVAPSTITYLVYNWDVVASAMCLLGILAFWDRKYFKAGLFLGLSFSTKLLTLGVAYYYLLKIITVGKSAKSQLSYLLGFLLSGVLPFLALYIASPLGFTAMINHHASWYCENCLYILAVRDIWSPLHKVLYFLAAGIYVLFVTVITFKRGFKLEPLNLYIYASIPVVLNYVFSPQMMLLLTPLAAIGLDNPLLALYGAADLFNAALIVEFFRELISGGSPWLFGSITQLMALTRNILLLAITVATTIALIIRRNSS